MFMFLEKRCLSVFGRLDRRGASIERGIIMTYEVALKRIKEKFADVDASKLADMAVQVTLTDADCGGTFYFKSENGTVAVEGYDYKDNDAVIDIDRTSLMNILAGKTTLDKAIAKGAATAKGNFEKLATLETAIPKYERKPAAKTETKAAEKAEPVEEKAPDEKKTASKAVAKPAEKKVAVKAAAPKAVAKKPAAKSVKKK